MTRIIVAYEDTGPARTFGPHLLAMACVADRVRCAAYEVAGLFEPIPKNGNVALLELCRRAAAVRGVMPIFALFDQDRLRTLMLQQKLIVEGNDVARMLARSLHSTTDCGCTPWIGTSRRWWRVRRSSSAKLYRRSPSTSATSCWARSPSHRTGHCARSCATRCLRSPGSSRNSRLPRSVERGTSRPRTGRRSPRCRSRGSPSRCGSSASPCRAAGRACPRGRSAGARWRRSRWCRAGRAGR